MVIIIFAWFTEGSCSAIPAKSSSVIARHKFELDVIFHACRAHNRCQKCSVKFNPRMPPQFEHINGSLKDNRPVNLRALCSECFKLVENKEKSRKGIFGKMRNIIG
jgi:5-methylcytosine-specific restriction protein A